MRQTAIVTRLNLPDVDQRLSLFYITVDGIIECWIQTLRDALESSGFEANLAFDYGRDLSQLLTKKRGSSAIYTSLDKVPAEQLYPIVDNFIRKILSIEKPLDG
jgi:hypothetical protein